MKTDIRIGVIETEICVLDTETLLSAEVLDQIARAVERRLEDADRVAVARKAETRLSNSAIAFDKT